LLSSESDMQVVGDANYGDEAVRQVRHLRPDVMLMDIRMPRVDGLQATPTIAEDPELAATCVLILTTFETDEYIFEAVRAGASGLPDQGLRAGGPAERRPPRGTWRSIARAQCHVKVDRSVGRAAGSRSSQPSRIGGADRPGARGAGAGSVLG